MYVRQPQPTGCAACGDVVVRAPRRALGFIDATPLLVMGIGGLVLFYFVFKSAAKQANF